MMGEVVYKFVSMNSLVRECKVVGIYFSHCKKPPIKFVRWYENIKETRGLFEVICVDAGEESTLEMFNNAIKEMPWPALPFNEDKTNTVS